MKIKTVLNDEIRLFKFDGSVQDALKALDGFVRTHYGLESFVLQYKDEENDLVTMSGSEDLEDALEVAKESKQTLKVFVRNTGALKEKTPDEDVDMVTLGQDGEEERPVVSSISIDGEKSHSSPRGQEEDEAEPREEIPHSPPCGGAFGQLLKDLGNDLEFREEFISFVSTFLVLMREQETNMETAFAQSLSMHEKVFEHPAMKEIGSKAPVMFAHVPPPAMAFLSMIDPNLISDYIVEIVQIAKGEQVSNPKLPPFIAVMLHHKIHAAKSGGGWGGSSPCGFPPMFGGLPPQHPAGLHGMPHPFAGFGPFGGFGHGRRRGCGGRRGKWGGRRGGRGRCRGRPDYANHPAFGGNGHCWGANANGNGNRPRSKSRGPLGADIVSDDHSLADGSHVTPKQLFVKTWKLKNTGREPWPVGTTLQFRGRKCNPMVTQTEFPVKTPVLVGEEVEVSIVVEVPNRPGRFRSNWRLVTPQGKTFGEKMTCKLDCGAEYFIDEEKKTEEEQTNNPTTASTGPMSKKEWKQMRKELKRQWKQNQSVEDKNAKLRARREKLLARLDKLNSKIGDSNEQSQLENVIEEPDEASEDEDMDVEMQEKEEEVANVVESLDEDIEIVDIPNENENEQQIEAEGAQEEEEPFVYADALQQIVGMGFANEELVKELLIANDGQVHVVVDQLMA